MKRLGRAIGMASELGMAMGLTAAGFVVLGLVVGRWIDSRLGTRPTATLVSLVVGALSGQIAIYRLAIRSARRLSAQGDAVDGGASSALGRAVRALAILLMPALVGLGLGLMLDAIIGNGALMTLLLALIGSIVGLALCVWHLRGRSTS